jgi:hypothetical protein
MLEVRSSFKTKAIQYREYRSEVKVNLNKGIVFTV